jgi:hypothetical protein
MLLAPRRRNSVSNSLIEPYSIAYTLTLKVIVIMLVSNEQANRALLTVELTVFVLPTVHASVTVCIQ